MKEFGNKILIVGIGNCGRTDDGLGWAFLDQINEKLHGNMDYVYRYQLQIEDAELISHYGTVYFVDAHTHLWEDGFKLERCQPKANHGFSTHELEPETVVYLSETLYNKTPDAFIFGISGVRFDLKIGLTKEAETNLSRALEFFNENILHLVT
ncbi:MAG: hydrogenase maturation protease [Eudoraea sp.]|nr:hydrogenase maturation protease [Eudoraea sp.]NNK31178.1 hydrogenase maturation protease [Flavobacteriaceae bacterium]